MDRIQPLIYPRPLVPMGQREAASSAPQKLKGTIVGLRAGRRGELYETHIVTIKLVAPTSDLKRLLHADVEILLPRT